MALTPLEAALAAAVFVQGCNSIAYRVRCKREDKKSAEEKAEKARDDCETARREMVDCHLRWRTARRNALLEIQLGVGPVDERRAYHIEVMSTQLDCALSGLWALARQAKDSELYGLAADCDAAAQYLHEWTFRYLCLADPNAGEVPEDAKYSEAHEAALRRYDEVCRPGATPAPLRVWWKPQTWWSKQLIW